MNEPALLAERGYVPASMDKKVGTVASLIISGMIKWDNLTALHEAEPLPLSRDWARTPGERELAVKLRDHLVKLFGQEVAFSQVCDTLINHLIDRGPAIWPEELNKLCEPGKTPA